jgi:hypothetical protein
MGDGVGEWRHGVGVDAAWVSVNKSREVRGSRVGIGSQNTMPLVE